MTVTVSPAEMLAVLGSMTEEVSLPAMRVESVTKRVATADDNSERVRLAPSATANDTRTAALSVATSLHESLQETTALIDAGPSVSLTGRAMATYAVSSGTVMRIRFALDSENCTAPKSEPDPGPAVPSSNAATQIPLLFPLAPVMENEDS